MDPNFVKKRTDLIVAAARRLDKCKMIRFDERGGNFYPTDLGRTAYAFFFFFLLNSSDHLWGYNLLFSVDFPLTCLIRSHYYIENETIELVDRFMNGALSDAGIFDLVSQASEFRQIKVREDEVSELELLEEESVLAVKGGVNGEEGYGKVNVLLQAYISGLNLNSFSLISDMNYIAQVHYWILSMP